MTLRAALGQHHFRIQRPDRKGGAKQAQKQSQEYLRQSHHAIAEVPQDILKTDISRIGRFIMLRW